jgi:hypothetical protein
MVTGGVNNLTQYEATTEIFNPATGLWTASGSLIVPRGGHAAVRLNDGRVLVAGGNGSTGTASSAELFDPSAGV